ncbi:MAG: neutral/alkaline non-lysosomal ceramidase N-terminal domain-containing protein [Fuerstiella sp.]
MSRVDVTPPVGIYHRMWGAAKHDKATGVHRPLTATALVMSSETSSAANPDAVFVAVDHCLLWYVEMASLLNMISDQTGIPVDSITVFFSHTHAAGLMGLERIELPGGELIPAYLESLGRNIVQAVNDAVATMQSAIISYGSGRCNLATNRDFFDPNRDHAVCGFNPQGTADDGVLVGRVQNAASGKSIATIVNYACHPTTLAWDNTLISPDYPGAMREVVEDVTKTPCFFIQGASGDIGPRDGFVGDVAVADRNGRQLGYAVLAALENMPPASTTLQYTGAVVSGATIGTWQFADVDDQRQSDTAAWKHIATTVDIPYRSDLPDREELQRERSEWLAEQDAAVASGDTSAAADARAMAERMTRRLVRVEHLPVSEALPYAVQIWKLGDAIWLALDGELYNVLQRNLRETFPGTSIVLGTLANGSRAWYIPDRDSFGKGLYQEDASVLAQGALEQLFDFLVLKIRTLLPTP